MKSVSWEEPRKIKCPICNTDMEFDSYEYNEYLSLKFKCPKCDLTTTLYFNKSQIIRTILSKIGYAEEEVKTEEGEEVEASS